MFHHNKQTLTWSPEAVRDLVQIWDYYSFMAGRAFARKTLSELRATCQKLPLTKSIGRNRADLHGQVRSFVIKRYIIFYRVKDEGLEIARVLNHHRYIDEIVT